MNSPKYAAIFIRASTAFGHTSRRHARITKNFIRPVNRQEAEVAWSERPDLPQLWVWWSDRLMPPLHPAMRWVEGESSSPEGWWPNQPYRPEGGPLSTLCLHYLRKDLDALEPFDMALEHDPGQRGIQPVKRYDNMIILSRRGFAAVRDILVRAGGTYEDSGYGLEPVMLHEA